jgi:hypothetical protein
MIKKIICSLFAIGILVAPIAEARGCRVRGHFRHYRSGAVTYVRSHRRAR